MNPIKSFSLIISVIAIFSTFLLLYYIKLSRKARKIPKYPAEELDTDTFTRKNIIIPLKDGTKIWAYYYSPKSTNQSGATIITTHGFKNTALAPNEVFLAKTLVEAGHQVFAYDSRYHGNSTEKEYAHFTPDYFPKAMIDDTLEIAQFIKKCPSVDKNRLGYIGFSYGGITALSGALRDPDITFICAGCAVYDYNELWRTLMKRYSYVERFYTKEVFFHRQNYKDFYDAFEQVSPKNQASYAIGKKIHLMHCKDDPLVLYDISLNQNQEIFSVPEDNVVVFDQGGHDFKGHHEEIRKKLLEWIDETFHL